MKKVLFFAALFTFMSLGLFAQSYTQTYTAQDLNGVPDVTTSTTQASPCPGLLTFTTIPPGVVIDSALVTYDYFTSFAGFGSTTTQRSYVRCVTTGVSEANLAFGPSVPPGQTTASYSRIISIANGVSTGSLSFELHAGHVALIPGGCSGSNQFVLNNSWAITVYTSGAATCPDPTSLVKTNSQTNALQVDWTPGGSETSWELRHGLTGTALNSMNSSIVSAHPSIISGLDSATSYDIYVRAICGANDSSFWEGPLTAVTDTPICATPTNATTSNITDVQASFGWTENGFATEWEIEWGPQGFSLGSGTLIPQVQSNPWIFQNLTASTAYEAYVRSNCGLNKSDWLGPVSFTTLAGVCDPPTNLTSGNASETTVDLSWFNPVSYLANDMEYGPTGFTQGTGTFINGIIGSSQTLTGLTPGTGYQAYVRGVCNTTSNSVWTGPHSFGTTIGLNDLENAGIKIFPNPVANTLIIELANAESAQLTDASGRQVLDIRLTEGQNNIDISGLPAGWYIVQIGSLHKSILINR